MDEFNPRSRHHRRSLGHPDGDNDDDDDDGGGGGGER
jgi:hypothetical protein